MQTKTKATIGGTIAAALIGGGALFLMDPPRTRAFPTVPCNAVQGWGAADLWPAYAQSQAGKNCANVCGGYPDGLDVGALRTVNGVVQIIAPRTPTGTNPLSGEWVAFDRNNAQHCTTASTFASYGKGWSYGPTHNGHDDCTPVYTQLFGHAPSEMERRDCDYNTNLFKEWKRQLCVKQGGTWCTTGNGVCAAAGTACPVPPVCGDGTCNGNETPLTCPKDCKPTPGPVCGDGQCSGGETALSCPLDCTVAGPCPADQACRPAPPVCNQIDLFEVERVRKMCQTWNLSAWQKKSACEHYNWMKSYQPCTQSTGANVMVLDFHEDIGLWAFEPAVSSSDPLLLAEAFESGR